MRYAILFILIYIISLIRPTITLAVTDPLVVPNNRFGIHVIDSNDLEDAARLVNSNGGDWGYITIVITKNERDIDRWQNTFDQLRRLHLIPIIRIATQLEGDKWQKPDPNDINSWADFLNSLNWVVKNRYVIIFNEPNHAKEWGSDINPEEYTQILSTFSDRLKEKSEDFFILPAGLDAAAPNGSDTMDISTFLSRMMDKDTTIFDKLDGWTSHSYPNPGFVGTALDFGKGTIKSYIWEQNLLKELGFTKNLPVFITETGWPHREGINFNRNFLPQNLAGEYTRQAFTSVWRETNLVAITPFVFSYQSYPFDNFSWKMPENIGFYDAYYEVEQIPKTRGEPEQRIDIEIAGDPIAQKLITDSHYTFLVNIKNSGQSIFEESQNYTVDITSSNLITSVLENYFIEPDKNGAITYELKTGNTPGKYDFNISLKHKEEIIDSYDRIVEVIEPPNLKLEVNTGLNTQTSSTDFSLLILDDDEKPVVEFTNLDIKNSKGEVKKLKDVVVGKNYRVVLKKPYYLPRQSIITFQEADNFIKFKPLIPLDLDLDGKFSLGDYWLIVFHPLFALSLVFQ
ncbi:hypothetical protein A2773_00755 [Candidatus Gottesmanbacteria bacterium RIFCSPHIGHO2_01_FULL_39_10]|uniref:Glycoside hydrolase family 5 domain-containing protein n=1 Tax=Candidatus Gottesmanbacteria bacterium RIFCSPHIGHO2_01_FULL_39_10 TaxID=1798375 RepID=A0A1F5ZLV6_9BACT|nr:MAG: hypothetical protein A2773_00755 [Candidatus Gottesmanbacteria bacterium RIFCSPHIGHO2_01_FULL_39_10]